ncbi:hypothetical protein [Deinococcus sedimenti]|uniref:DUF3168 domain-containing protein n=1 Tax=Deinococcus sedimenti TaxID=1867090 RepID=A0ABQ2RZS2_9DEIO|nr:hypothetical protein [Deinococcus sedimenti]GGR84392.1 hypothetical protein GCM10008960_09290 [Deinococcus sedimenti]
MSPEETPALTHEELGRLIRDLYAARPARPAPRFIAEDPEVRRHQYRLALNPGDWMRPRAGDPAAFALAWLITNPCELTLREGPDVQLDGAHATLSPALIRRSPDALRLYAL